MVCTADSGYYAISSETQLYHKFTKQRLQDWHTDVTKAEIKIAFESADNAQNVRRLLSDHLRLKCGLNWSQASCYNRKAKAMTRLHSFPFGMWGFTKS